MSGSEDAKSVGKSSIVDYVGHFIEKRNYELRETVGDSGDTGYPPDVDKDSITIQTDVDGHQPEREVSISSCSSFDVYYPSFNYHLQ